MAEAPPKVQVLAVGPAAAEAADLLEGEGVAWLELHRVQGLVDALASSTVLSLDAVLLDATILAADCREIARRLSGQHATSHLPILFVASAEPALAAVEGELVDDAGRRSRVRQLEVTLRAHVALGRGLREDESRLLGERVPGAGRAESVSWITDDTWKGVMDNLGALVLVRDAKRNCPVYINAMWQEFTGLSTESFFRDPTVVLSAVHPEDRERVARSQRKYLLSGGGENEFRFVAVGGKVRWVWARNFALHDGDGQITYVVTVVDDITTRKTAELELVARRIELERAARRRVRELEEQNAAMIQLAKRLGQERRRTQEELLSSVRRSVLPLVERLASKAGTLDRAHVDLLRTELDALTSTLPHQLGGAGFGLTSTEQEICGYVRRGLSSRQIGELIGSAESTVAVHRRNIRKKLGLTGTPQKSLQVFLESLEQGALS